MAPKPNYDFERRERERLAAIKAEEKARAKRERKAATTPETADDPEAPPRSR